MKLIVAILFILLLILATTSSELKAEKKEKPTKCFDSSWVVVSKKSSFGDMVVYVVPDLYTITSTNVACLLGIEFLKKVNDVPKKMVVGIVKENYSSGYLVQWNLDDDYLLLIETSDGNGIFTKYPNPLDRIKEVMTSQPFPKPSQLDLDSQQRFQRNYTSVDLEKLLK